MSTTIARWGLAGLLWLLRRPFLLSRRLWVCTLLAALLLDAAAWVLAPLLVSLILLAPPLVCAAVLFQWWWLGRGGHPIVFVSLFKGRSRVGRQAAQTHLGALATYMRESEHLAVVGPLDIRVIDLPLSEAQAERLLRISKALVVVRGTGDAAAETSRWEWWAHFRDQRPEFDLSEHRFSSQVSIRGPRSSISSSRCRRSRRATTWRAIWRSPSSWPTRLRSVTSTRSVR
jgi:hypothetical protein